MIPSATALRALRQTLRQLSIAPVTRPSSSSVTPSIFALPLGQQVRHASLLGNLRDVRSSFTHKKRVGRGPSSGKGKTSGRGHKGQGQRGGHRPKNFEGGQTPQWITNPPRGKNFKNPLMKHYSELNLCTVQRWIEQGRLDPTQPITLKELYESRAVHGIKDGVKLLAREADELKVPITIIVNKASRQAIEKVEAIGGKIETRFYTREGIRFVTRPHLFPDGHRLARPTSRFDIEYYRDPAHRGYLVPTVLSGESPSLYWYKKHVKSVEEREKEKEERQKRTPEEVEAARRKKEIRKAQALNRVF
ncbi:hypothetical protein DRE_01800 [Drechslerella stenobrocha 248]|uniref:Large ribosomal subunit protein uL15/eL18 domain-containing protein n=1 Tax=Drechslerella stenobrocha 248 TaxID=1043628 RepID=W7I8G2_9PEZI|nr:hypothetical protein DRE_01800 [Drechslerella stenobrocha 248]